MNQPVRLTRQQVERALNLIEGRIAPLERCIHLLAQALPAPLLYDSAQRHVGFRYGKPDRRHFCLLKLVRCVSALNAMTALARGGYNQELCVLVRTVAECTTQIEFVLSSTDEDDELRPTAKELVDTFFADFARNNMTDFKRSKLCQGQVHAHVGEGLDAAVPPSERSEEYRNRTAEQLLSHIYLVYSNYVHCKYPETMDLFGGPKREFHLSGMSDTPKDYESIEILSTFVDTVALSVRSTILQLHFRDVINADEQSRRWLETPIA